MDCKLQHNNLNYNVEIFHEGWNMYKVMLKEWGFLGKKEEEKKDTHFEGAIKHKNLLLLLLLFFKTHETYPQGT
jgi:hypothetical protein